MDEDSEQHYTVYVLEDLQKTVGFHTHNKNKLFLASFYTHKPLKQLSQKDAVAIMFMSESFAKENPKYIGTIVMEILFKDRWKWTARVYGEECHALLQIVSNAIKKYEIEISSIKYFSCPLNVMSA